MIERVEPDAVNARSCKVSRTTAIAQNAYIRIGVYEATGVGRGRKMYLILNTQSEAKRLALEITHLENGRNYPIVHRKVTEL
jgi:hypothetical protein